MNKFTLDLNLDDDSERHAFLRRMFCLGPRAVSNKLGISGEGSSGLAKALKNYAINRETAHGLRKDGDIAQAARYEDICDRIYREDIICVCECW